LADDKAADFSLQPHRQRRQALHKSFRGEDFDGCPAMKQMLHYIAFSVQHMKRAFRERMAEIA